MGAFNDGDWTVDVEPVLVSAEQLRRISRVLHRLQQQALEGSSEALWLAQDLWTALPAEHRMSSSPMERFTSEMRPKLFR